MKTQILLRAFQLILPLWFGLDLKVGDQFEKATVIYKEVGPLSIKADVYHYKDAKVRPVVVSLHGGALIMGHRESVSGPVKDFAPEHGLAGGNREEIETAQRKTFEFVKLHLERP